MKILFVGDAVIKNVDGFSLDDKLVALIKNHDFCLVNFEGGLEGPRDFQIQKIGPHVFNAADAARTLKAAGFNVFALANNHILDYGADSFNKTLALLDSLSVKRLGAGKTFLEAYEPLLLDAGDEKIAIVNACHAEFGVYKDKYVPLQGGYAWINNPIVDDTVLKLKAKGYLVVVVAHAGVEFMELPLPEWRERYRRFVDLGADLVIGGHPHIVQGKELYNGKPIYYSLGNFFFPNLQKSQDFEWNHGLAVSYDTKTGACQEFFLEQGVAGVSFCSNPALKQKFDKRSQILCDDVQYYKMINQIVCDLWANTYKPLYDAVPNFINCRNHFAKNLLKYFAKKFIFRSRYQKDLNETLLLHNIQIESHRYVAERFLYLQNCKVNNLLYQEP